MAVNPSTSKTAITDDEVVASVKVEIFENKTKHPKVTFEGKWSGRLVDVARKFINRGYRIHIRDQARELAKLKAEEED